MDQQIRYLRGCKKTQDYLYSNLPGVGDNSFAYQYFKPILPVSDKIELITKKFTGNTIGVHIRRTDKANSIQYSPIDLFINKMQPEVDAKKDATFFLCTDGPQTVKAIIEVFGRQ